jgi:hypothetical protein
MDGASSFQPIFFLETTAYCPSSGTTYDLLLVSPVWVIKKLGLGFFNFKNLFSAFVSLKNTYKIT